MLPGQVVHHEVGHSSGHARIERAGTRLLRARPQSRQPGGEVPLNEICLRKLEWKRLRRRCRLCFPKAEVVHEFEFHRGMIRLPGESLAEAIAEMLVEADDLLAIPRSRARGELLANRHRRTLVAHLEQAAVLDAQRHKLDTAQRREQGVEVPRLRPSGTQPRTRAQCGTRIHLVRRGQQLRTGRVGATAQRR